MDEYWIRWVWRWSKQKNIVLKDYLKNTNAVAAGFEHCAKMLKIKMQQKKKMWEKITEWTISWSFVHKIGVWMMWSEYLGFNEYYRHWDSVCVLVSFFFIYKEVRPKIQCMRPCNEQWACHVKSSENIWQIAHCRYTAIPLLYYYIIITESKEKYKSNIP